VSGAERGHDQALHAFSEHVDEHLVVSQRDRRQIYTDLSAEPGPTTGDLPQSRTWIWTRPSTIWPSGPKPGEMNAAGLAVCALAIRRAAQIWSFTTTTEPTLRARQRRVAHRPGRHDRRIGASVQPLGLANLPGSS
jgi:hypothetical protein